jgi:hypothetical protein
MSDGNEAEWMTEWKECRAAISRFDQIIVDLRKYGFSIITGLLTADTFFLIKAGEAPVWQKVGLYVVLAVLIYALFSVDRCFEIFLRGAVERANELEKRHGMGLTQVISDKSLLANTDTWGKHVYSLFVIAAAVPSIASILNPVKDAPAPGLAPILLIVGLVLLFLALILVYHETKQAKVKTIYGEYGKTEK